MPAEDALGEGRHDWKYSDVIAEVLAKQGQDIRMG